VIHPPLVTKRNDLLGNPYVYLGHVASSEASCHKEISVLRDTGADVSLISRDSLPSDVDTATGNSMLVQGLGSETFNVPLHNIYLHTRDFTGVIPVGVLDSIPKKGVDLILGNDLAGSVVSGIPIMTKVPQNRADESSDVEKDIYPACVTTRAMAKVFDKRKQNVGTKQGKVIQDFIISTDELIAAQQTDAELNLYFKLVEPIEDLVRKQTGFFFAGRDSHEEMEAHCC